MTIWKVGVIGCGQMGSGIVQVCAQASYTVIAAETSAELLEKGLDAINKSLERQCKKGTLETAEKDRILRRITGTTRLDTLDTCDLVIEAVAEKMELKQQIFTKLDTICQPRTILATNTSSLNVAEIAAATSRSQNVLGLHFFNPVPALKLVEIVKTADTTDTVYRSVKEFAASIGKTPVTVKDSPGFIVNRLITPQILNAIRLAEAGIADREDIDTAMTLGLNHPVGPFALADLIGLDTVLSIADSIYQNTGDEQYAAPETLKQMVAEGKLGRKTGKGFFIYK